MLDAPFASFHPMDNTGSTAINKDGILKLKELAGRDDSNYEILDFSKFGDGDKKADVTAPKVKKEPQ